MMLVSLKKPRKWRSKERKISRAETRQEKGKKLKKAPPIVPGFSVLRFGEEDVNEKRP